MRQSLQNLTTTLLLILLIDVAANGSNLGGYYLSHDFFQSYNPGDSIEVECSVENHSSDPAESYTVDIYAGSYHIGSESRGPVEGYSRDSFYVSCSLPYDITTGMYNLIMVIDSPDDDDTGNNEIYAGRNISVVVPAPPDISIQTVDATEGIYKPGDSIEVTIEINCGEGQLTADMDVNFYASADRNITVADYKIHSEGFSSLEPDEYYSLEARCGFPSDIPDGYYYIGIIVTDPELGTYHDRNSVWVSEPMDAAVQNVSAAAGTYSPGDEIKVYSLIKNIGERTTESYVVDYYLSTDTAITIDDHKIGYAARSGLAPDQQHSYETTCRIPINAPAGDCYVGMIVNCPKDYDTGNSVGRDTAAINVVHPAGYLCGRVNYEDRRNYALPIRYALVEVCAEDNNNDPLDDPLLGKTYTDRDGRYAMILAKDQNSSRDIYVKILTEGVSGAYPDTTTRICVLKDDVLDEAYSLVSDLHSHPGDSSVIIDMTAPYFEGGEFAVFDSIVEGFHKARTYLNIEIGEVAVYWPSEAETSYFDPCDTGIYISQDDRGDRDVIMHEYGHYVAQIHGIALGPVGKNSAHYWDKDLRYEPASRTDEEAMNLAFREAWASLFSVATQYGDTWLFQSGDSYYDDYDEESGWSINVDLDNEGEAEFSPGQYFENMNAGALWDIFDDKNDRISGKDTLSDPSLEKIWTISRDYKPETILDFWNKWFQIYEYEEEMEYIFQGHEMRFDRP